MIERQELPVFPTLVLAAACSSFPGLSGWLLLLLGLLLCPQVTPSLPDADLWASTKEGCSGHAPQALRAPPGWDGGASEPVCWVWVFP